MYTRHMDTAAKTQNKGETMVAGAVFFRPVTDINAACATMANDTKAAMGGRA